MKQNHSTAAFRCGPYAPDPPSPDPGGGGKLTETGACVKSDFGYNGHYFDRPTGLALAWWRGYDAGLGRCVSMDPIGLAGEWNLYGYVSNAPLALVDPTGQKEANPDGENFDLYPPLRPKPTLHCNGPMLIQERARCDAKTGVDFEMCKRGAEDMWCEYR